MTNVFLIPWDNEHIQAITHTKYVLQYVFCNGYSMSIEVKISTKHTQSDGFPTETNACITEPNIYFMFLITILLLSWLFNPVLNGWGLVEDVEDVWNWYVTLLFIIIISLNITYLYMCPALERIVFLLMCCLYTGRCEQSVKNKCLAVRMRLLGSAGAIKLCKMEPRG